MPHILFTGGGTAGHVTPNVALIESFQQLGWQASYVGSAKGIEREIIGAIDVPFHAVASGKLRRYFSWQNFIDPFLVMLGVLQSLWLCMRWRPDAVFSKGGFVAVPVVVAAWLLRIPVVSHESDVTPGLANRLTFRFCRAICVTFDETRNYLPTSKVVLAGTPLRQSLIAADAERGLTYLGFEGSKPVLLVFGGSLGAGVINQQLRSVLTILLNDYDIVHVTGPEHVDPAFNQPGYLQKAYINDAFGDVLAAADVVVCRAGANTLYELFALRKPHLLIPLSKAASRGDQLENAALFAQSGLSRVIQEAELSDERFVAELAIIQRESEAITQRLGAFEVKDSIGIIRQTLEQAMG